MIEYKPKKVIVSFEVVVATWNSGDWGTVHTNGGSGEIDWDNPVGGRVLLITPQTPIAGGIATVKIDIYVSVPGMWKFGVLVYDKWNNEQVGDAVEKSEYVDLVPLYPLGMSVESYDYEGSELVLELL